jgi:hypothetical protein
MKSGSRTGSTNENRYLWRWWSSRSCGKRTFGFGAFVPLSHELSVLAAILTNGTRDDDGEKKKKESHHAFCMLSFVELQFQRSRHPSRRRKARLKNDKYSTVLYSTAV